MFRTTRISSAIALLVVASMWAAPSLRARSAKSAPSVTGTWTINVANSPHGPLTMGLTLKQEGKNVSGTFASPHGDMPVQGEFTDGTLTLSASGGQITFTAKLSDDETLSGYLSSEMGDMKWTAKKVKDAK